MVIEVVYLQYVKANVFLAVYIKYHHDHHLSLAPTYEKVSLNPTWFLQTVNV